MNQAELNQALESLSRLADEDSRVSKAYRRLNKFMRENQNGLAILPNHPFIPPSHCLVVNPREGRAYALGITAFNQLVLMVRELENELSRDPAFDLVRISNEVNRVILYAMQSGLQKAIKRLAVQEVRLKCDKFIDGYMAAVRTTLKCGVTPPRVYVVECSTYCLIFRADSSQSIREQVSALLANKEPSRTPRKVLVEMAVKRLGEVHRYLHLNRKEPPIDRYQRALETELSSRQGLRRLDDISLEGTWMTFQDMVRSNIWPLLAREDEFTDDVLAEAWEVIQVRRVMES